MKSVTNKGGGACDKGIRKNNPKLKANKTNKLKGISGK